MISPSTPDDLPVKGLGSRTLSIEELIEQEERQMRDAQSKISSAKKVANAGNFSSKKTAALPPRPPTVQQKRQQQQQQQQQLVSPKYQTQQHSSSQSWANDGVQNDQPVALANLYASADTTSRAKDASKTHASELLEFEAIERELLASSPDDLNDNEEWSEQYFSTAAAVTKEQKYAACDGATAAVDDHAYSDDADLEELSHAEGLLDADKYPWHGASNNTTAADDDGHDYEHSSTVKRDDTNKHSTEQQEDEAELQSANSYHHFADGYNAEYSTADIAGEFARPCADESTHFDDSHAWGDDDGTGVDDDYYHDHQHEQQQGAIQATPDADALPESLRSDMSLVMMNEHTDTDAEAVPSSQRYAAAIIIHL
jgi:hypothetical protein